MAEYNSISQRIGKVKGEILAHAMSREVLAIGGEQKKMPRNQGEEIIYRRYIPFGAATTDHNTQNRPEVDPQEHQITEGVTPDPDDIEYVDINARIDQYGCMYEYTDKVAMLHEDDIPEQERIHCGERIGLLREMIRWGAVRTCTNKFYAGGTSRSTVDSIITLKLLRNVVRNLMANRATMVTRVLASSPDFGTARVESGYLVFTHTDQNSDIRDLPGFVKTAEYGKRELVSDHEVGTCEEFRFITSPDLQPYRGAGATSTGLGLVSTSSKVDVYPLIVCAKDCWASLSLRGAAAPQPFHIPYSKRDKADPMGQRGYLGAQFWDSAFVQNHGWMAMVEAGVTDL